MVCGGTMEGGRFRHNSRCADSGRMSTEDGRGCVLGKSGDDTWVVSKMVWGIYIESRAIQLRAFVLVTKFPKGDGRRCGDIERVDAALHRNSGHVVGLSQDGVAQAVAFRAQEDGHTVK